MNDLPSSAVLESQVLRLRSAGGDADTAYGDISVPAQAADMACHAIATLGGLDYLIMPARRAPRSLFHWTISKR